MTSKILLKYDYVIYIGRFQPFHDGHLKAVQQALRIGKHLIILVGSAFASPSIRNPFPFEMRRKLISETLKPFGEFTILPVPDFFYSDNNWLAHIQGLIGTVTNPSDKIALIGHKKDHSSYYLDLFPKWDFIPVSDPDILDATSVRYKYFENSASIKKARVSSTTKSILDQFSSTSEYKHLSEEYQEIRKYQELWLAAPYPPIFVTTDAVVTCCGYVLLIKRKSYPGKGLLALPGGFINPNELLEEGCLRELREETKIKIPLPVLKGSITSRGVFDHPLRSVRGRTITHAFYIELKDKELPKVKGSDDAESASWFPLSEVLSHPELCFEDHGQIIESFVGRGK